MNSSPPDTSCQAQFRPVFKQFPCKAHEAQRPAGPASAHAWHFGLVLFLSHKLLRAFSQQCTFLYRALFPRRPRGLFLHDCKLTIAPRDPSCFNLVLCSTHQLAREPNSPLQHATAKHPCSYTHQTAPCLLQHPWPAPSYQPAPMPYFGPALASASFSCTN